MAQLFHVGGIGGNAVGEQDDSGQRLAAVMIEQLLEGVPERGAAAIEGELAKVL